MVPPSSVPVHGSDLSPEDAVLLRGPVPAEARDWVRGAVGNGARIVSTHPRVGGTSSAVHAVTVDDARGTRHDLVLRRYVRADWLAREPDLAQHEARVLALLESSAVAAPRLIAVDATGSECDVPAVLMTRLAGRIRWSARDVEQFLQKLVHAMTTIHAVPVPASVPIRSYARYNEDVRLLPPTGTSASAAWARAIEVHAGPPPEDTPTFIHRDFHPGNVLWVGHATSGIVDWVTASVGSPDADVGHCRLNLARHLGGDVAERLTVISRERTGRAAYDPYWDLVAAVGMLGDADPAPGRLPDLDEFVRRAVARLG